MVVSVHRYGIEDFNRLIFEGFDYELDPEVRTIIQTLSDQVGAPEYIRTPQFPKSNKRYDPINNASKGPGQSGRNRYGEGGSSNEDWNSFRQFQATKIVKKEGVEKTIDTIRKHLNKISDKNYENQRANIFSELRALVDADASVDDTENEKDINGEFDNVIGAVFTIASGNMFYSQLYAQLYQEMMAEFPVMKTNFKNNLSRFREIFNEIEYCNPDKDYDKFCAINKDNEKRRATALFYVNLMKLDVVSSDEITSIIKELCDYQMSKVRQDGNKHIVDELSEVVAIMVLNSLPKFKGQTTWDEIIEYVEKIASSKAADYPSITSKSIFKYMDIIDEVRRK